MKKATKKVEVKKEKTSTPEKLLVVQTVEEAPELIARRKVKRNQ